MNSLSKSQKSPSPDPGAPALDEESRIDRKSRTRAHLLDAMVEVGARVGYTESSVEQVIEGTGIARSTFYVHFRDLEECFLAALESLGEVVLGEVEARVGGAESNEAAQAAVGALIGFAEQRPAAARLLFLESLAGGRAALDLRDRLQEEVAAIVEAAWERTPGQEGGPDLPARAPIGGVFRLLAIRLRHGEAGLEGLASDLCGWLGSYSRESGRHRWRRPPAFEPVEWPKPESLPTLEAPPPLPGGRHRLTPTEVARSQRLRILNAAARCSFEKGYAQTGVADITSAAQVSRNVFYDQFRSKADAATEANERGFQAAMAACAGAFFAADEWPEKVWAGGSALLGFLALHPEQAYLGFIDFHAVGTPAIQHTYDKVAAFTLFLEEGYHWRPEAGDLPKASSEALAAVMFELAFAELCKTRSAEGLVEVLPLLAYMILAPFMGSEAATEFVEGKGRIRNEP